MKKSWMNALYVREHTPLANIVIKQNLKLAFIELPLKTELNDAKP